MIILPMLFALWAQYRVSSAFKKYAMVPVASHITGAEVARDILNAARINDVEVVQISGMLGDHYDPATKRLCLSEATYNTASIAAVGVAAHETGHAIQHATAYAPLKARMAIVPVTQIASRTWGFIFLAAFIFRSFAFIEIGVICMAVIMVFQLVTLPVEFDASRRAKIILQNMHIVRSGEEAAGINTVLDAAALTYVAAFAAALGNLLYLLSLSQRRST